MNTRIVLETLLAQVDWQDRTLLEGPVAAILAQLGDTDVETLTARDIAGPLASVGYDVAEYLGQMPGWSEAYEELGDLVPWVSKQGVDHPHPVVVEAADAGFGVRGRVLEMGCGYGSNAAFLASRGAEVVAYDVAERAIERARELFGARLGCTFICANAFHIDELPGSFDFVVDSWCLHHIPGHLTGLYVDTLTRLLRPGGELLVQCHAPQWKPTESALFSLLGAVGKAIKYILTCDCESCFTTKELERLFRPCVETMSIEHRFDDHVHQRRHYSYVVRGVVREPASPTTSSMPTSTSSATSE